MTRRSYAPLSNRAIVLWALAVLSLGLLDCARNPVRVRLDSLCRARSVSPANANVHHILCSED